MPEVQSMLILAAVLLPFAGAGAALAVGRRGVEAAVHAAALATFAAMVAVLVLARGGAPEAHLLTLLPGLDISFRADSLGLTFGLLAAGLWVVSSVYSSGYVRATRLRHRRRYFACFAASIGAAAGVALAANLLTFLLFYEVLTLTTYPLVAHKQTPEAIAGGRRYLCYALTGGLLLTVAVVWTWLATGTLEFTPGGFVQGRLGPGALGGLLLLYLLGCGVKAAIMPLHAWLPAAMVAPSPVSALLHAVAVVKAGVFGCIRVLGFVFGPEALRGTPWPDILLAFCGFTMVAGSLLALRQDHLKRRLAYSTVVHLSYIVLGAALLAPSGFSGAVMHMVNHGLAKITLFFCAGAIYATAHVEHVSELRGLAHRMPGTFAAFTVAALALIGVPGLCGFPGKLLLAQGSVEAHQYAYLAVMLGASLLSAAYLLPILAIAYAAPAPAPEGQYRHAAGEARPALLWPLLATTALVLAFGLFPPLIDGQYGLAQAVARQVFGGAP